MCWSSKNLIASLKCSNWDYVPVKKVGGQIFPFPFLVTAFTSSWKWSPSGISWKSGQNVWGMKKPFSNTDLFLTCPIPTAPHPNARLLDTVSLNIPPRPALAKNKTTTNTGDFLICFLDISSRLSLKLCYKPWFQSQTQAHWSLLPSQTPLLHTYPGIRKQWE